MSGIMTLSEYKRTLRGRVASIRAEMEAAVLAGPQPTELAAYAYINHSRWVADCPACNSADFVDLDQGTFLCLLCHASMSLVWPENRDEIEQALLARPLPKNRNWRPGETVNVLVAENIEHGLVGAK